jgi:hypothetical protein
VIFSANEKQFPESYVLFSYVLIAALHSENVVPQRNTYELSSNAHLLLHVCNMLLYIFYNKLIPSVQRFWNSFFQCKDFGTYSFSAKIFFFLVHSYLSSSSSVIRVFVYDYADLGSLYPFYYNMFGVVKWPVNQLCGLLITGKALMSPFLSLSSNGVNRRCLVTGCL